MSLDIWAVKCEQSTPLVFSSEYLLVYPDRYAREEVRRAQRPKQDNSPNKVKNLFCNRRMCTRNIRIRGGVLLIYHIYIQNYLYNYLYNYLHNYSEIYINYA